MKKTIIALVMALSALLPLAAPALASSAPAASPAAASPAAAPPPAAAVKSNNYVVTGAYVNVRSGPGSSYDKLGELKKGTTETGTESDGWLKFTYNGRTAYCSALYLSVRTDAAVLADTTDTAGADISDADGTAYVVSAPELNVRSGPGTSYTVLGKLEKGTKESGILENGWLKFTYKDETAYCSASYLSSAEE